MVKFTRKKIETLTLGEKMVKHRTERRMSIVEISRGTNIQVKYLSCLENGEYSKLPADVYVKGFIKSYAAFMGLNEDALIKQYVREKGIHTNIKQVGSENKAKKPIQFSSFVLTPKVVSIGLIAIAVIGSFWYLYQQINSFVSSPRLIILKPADAAIVDGKIAHVAGVTEKDASLLINEQPVLVNENGEFSEDIGLKEGLNTITVKSKNRRFDKESVRTISVKAQYDESVSIDASQMEELSAGFVAEVSVQPNPTWISIESDGSLVYSGTLTPNSIQKVEAKEKISITSGNGDGTFVRINGSDFGRVSDKSGTVSDAEYNREGRINKE